MVHTTLVIILILHKYLLDSLYQPKLYTLLLKSKILDLETLSRDICIVSNTYRIDKVHIEYVSYRLLTVSSQP